MNLCSFSAMQYVPEKGRFFDENHVPKGMQTMNLSGTEVRRRLVSGEDIPAWFSNPKVVKILRQSVIQNTLDELDVELEQAGPQQIIKRALESFGNDIAISFSGAEDVVLIDMAHKAGVPFRVFTLDTGRVFPET